MCLPIPGRRAWSPEGGRPKTRLGPTKGPRLCVSPFPVWRGGPISMEDRHDRASAHACQQLTTSEMTEEMSQSFR